VTFLGDLGRATWANSEQMNAQFLQFTLLPWLRTWEAAYRRVLLSPDERGEYSIEFVVDDLLRADTATRAAAYASFRSMGAMTANEIRTRENLPAMTGGDVLQNPFTTTTSTTHAPVAPNLRSVA
jgi:HK97 family phage portal protein